MLRWRTPHQRADRVTHTTAIPRSRTLAHAHARSSDPIAIAGYLGKGSSFDRALTQFAFTYADQNDLDYATMRSAIDDGRITAEDG